MAGIPRANWLVSLTTAMSALSVGLMRSDEIREMIRADFFFAFDQDRQIHGKTGVGLPGEDRFDVGPDLAFVVDGPAGVDGVVADGGLERRREPLIEGFGWLDVVVAVEKHGGPPGGVAIFGHHHGGTFARAGGHDLNVEAGEGELVGKPLGAAPHIRLMFGLGTNAGDGEKFLERGNSLVLSGIDGLQDFGKHDDGQA